MGADDKLDNAMDKVKGTVKENVGKVTGNESLEAEGHMDKAKGNVGEAVEDVKDAVTDR